MLKAAGMFVEAWLFLSDSVSVIMIGSPMTLVPERLRASGTSSTESSSTYAMLLMASRGQQMYS
jgi:hypothetical protein